MISGLCGFILLFIFFHIGDLYTKSHDKAAYPEILEFVFDDHKPGGIAVVAISVFAYIAVDAFASDDVRLFLNVVIALFTIIVVICMLLNSRLHNRRVSSYRSRNYYKRLYPQIIESKDAFLTWVDGDISDLSFVKFYARSKAPRVSGGKWLWEQVTPTWLTVRQDYIIARFTSPLFSDDLTFEVMPIVQSDEHIDRDEANDLTFEGEWPKTDRYEETLYFTYGFGEGTPSRYDEYESTIKIRHDACKRIQQCRESRIDWTKESDLYGEYCKAIQMAEFLIHSNLDEEISSKITDGTYKITIR